jgi:hypothetical protein
MTGTGAPASSPSPGFRSLDHHYTPAGAMAAPNHPEAPGHQPYPQSVRNSKYAHNPGGYAQNPEFSPDTRYIQSLQVPQHLQYISDSSFHLWPRVLQEPQYPSASQAPPFGSHALATNNDNIAFNCTQEPEREYPNAPQPLHGSRVSAITNDNMTSFSGIRDTVGHNAPQRYQSIRSEQDTRSLLSSQTLDPQRQTSLVVLQNPSVGEKRLTASPLSGRSEKKARLEEREDIWREDIPTAAAASVGVRARDFQKIYLLELQSVSMRQKTAGIQQSARFFRPMYQNALIEEN